MLKRGAPRRLNCAPAPRRLNWSSADQLLTPYRYGLLDSGGSSCGRRVSADSSVRLQRGFACRGCIPDTVAIAGTIACNGHLFLASPAMELTEVQIAARGAPVASSIQLEAQSNSKFNLTRSSIEL